ncbi:MAG: serine/threonine protein kinase [Verrucomicrobia bacterium]|nr:serine/threonine protein kinase [Verrucomicrobiota bacterium]
MNASREDALFALLLEMPAERRSAFLEATCQGDAALRQRLESRMQGRPPSDTELDPPTEMGQSPVAMPFPIETPDEAIGLTVGRYKLREKLGEGGCGVVYVAEQTEPVRRRVALKVIKLGMDTKQVVARFEAERQALAMMDHPNIARVLDAGTTDTGRPYFVMELVRGNRITDYCDDAELSARERLDLFVKVCQAIQHAHQKGIIHRDIKPSNILVTLHDGVPVPKVIDFGIAKATEGKLTENTVYTQLHQFIGTPAYMSPEQAEMSGLDIDTRSDIYSLGVLLYELLTGKTPFDAKELMASGLDEMRKTIREREPSRPSTRLATLQGEDLTTTAKRRSVDTTGLAHLLEGDLDWIVMKCLEKDRTRRYETANALAADILRHLSNEPVTARPASTLYKFQKAFRRNKLVFGAAAAVVLALVVGIVVSTWQAVVANQAREAESEQRMAAESAQKLAEAERTRADENAAKATKSELQALAEARRSSQVATLLKDMLTTAGPSLAQGRDSTLLKEILTNTASRLDREMADQPEVEADMRLVVGKAFRDTGDFATSKAMNQRALDLRRRVLGERNPAVAEALNELAKSTYLLGNLVEAEQLQREALSITEERKIQDLTLANMYNDLAILLRDGGKLLEAKDAYRASLEIKEKVITTKDEKMADAHLNMSLLLLDTQEFAQGETEATIALKGYQQLYGDTHPKVGMAQHNQAKLMREGGKLDQAAERIAAAITTYRALYPGGHLYQAEALDDWGQILQRQNQRGPSEEKFRESLEMTRRLHGNDHPQALLTMRHLALLKAQSPPDPEADMLIREATEMARKKFQKQPAKLADCLDDFGEYLARTGRLEEAEQILLEAHKLSVAGARQSWDLKASAQRLNGLYLKLGKPQEAKKWADEVTRISVVEGR